MVAARIYRTLERYMSLPAYWKKSKGVLPNGIKASVRAKTAEKHAFWRRYIGYNSSTIAGSPFQAKVFCIGAAMCDIEFHRPIIDTLINQFSKDGDIILCAGAAAKRKIDIKKIKAEDLPFSNPKKKLKCYGVGITPRKLVRRIDDFAKKLISYASDHGRDDCELNEEQTKEDSKIQRLMEEDRARISKGLKATVTLYRKQLKPKQKIFVIADGRYVEASGISKEDATFTCYLKTRTQT